MIHKLSWLAMFLAHVTLLSLVALHASDQIPGAAQSKPIAIVGATLHTISGEDLQSGTILFVDGKIIQIGSTAALPDDVEIIEAHGKHVYPGLIESSSDLGLVEINSIRATIDSSEIGALNPNVQALTAFNPDSELIPVARANGILLAISAPDGGMLAGRSSLLMLDGWSRDDMTLKRDTGMHARWPRNDADLKEFAEFFEQAKRYASAASDTAASDTADAPPRDLRLEAMGPVLNGKIPLIVKANEVDDIRSAVAFQVQHGIKLIIEGGSDACLCAELLKKQKVAVIVSSVYSNPSRRHSAYDEAYTLPKRLHDAGIAFCISAGGRFGANGIRNLPYNAATAAAYGLPEPVALRAITLSPAEILGVSDRVGALQAGLDATLFVADGNILETPTQVELAFVSGRRVDLNSRHTQLYHKYSEKYRRLGENGSE